MHKVTLDTVTEFGYIEQQEERKGAGGKRFSA